MMGWFQRIMPREERFFDMFDRHAQCSIDGSKALRVVLDGGAGVKEACAKVAAHEHDLQSAQKHGLRTAYVHRPLEHGLGKAAAIPPKERYDIVAADFLDLAGQLSA